MRSMLVEEGFELAQRMEQVALLPDQRPVEQFTTAGLPPPLHRAGIPNRGSPGPNTASGHGWNARSAAGPAAEERPCVLMALLGPVGVVEGFKLTQGARQVVLVPDQGAVEEFSRQVWTHRSMIAFILGIRTR
jgi:hypothetical protein